MNKVVVSAIILTLFFCGAVGAWAQEVESEEVQAQLEDIQEWAKDFSKDFEQALDTINREVQERSEIVREQVENVLEEHSEEIEQGREQLEQHLGEIREWLEHALQERTEEMEHFRREMVEEEEEENRESFEESYRLEFSIAPVDAQFVIMTAMPFYHVKSNSEGQSNTRTLNEGSNEQYEGGFEVSGTLIPVGDDKVLLSYEGSFHSETTSVNHQAEEEESEEREFHHGSLEGSAILSINKETVIFQQKDMTLSVRITKGDA